VTHSRVTKIISEDLGASGRAVGRCAIDIHRLLELISGHHRGDRCFVMDRGLVMCFVNGDGGMSNSRFNDVFLNNWLNNLMVVNTCGSDRLSFLRRGIVTSSMCGDSTKSELVS